MTLYFHKHIYNSSYGLHVYERDAEIYVVSSICIHHDLRKRQE